MADTLTTTTQVSPAVSTYYDRVLLMAATKTLVHLKFAQHARLDKKNGNTYKWRRYANLSAATTPMSEGNDPPAVALSKTDLTAQISFYGSYVKITDVVDLTVEDATLTIAAEKLGEQEDRTFDTLMRDILVACASSTNASAGSNGGTPTEITRSDIDGVRDTLMGYDAKPITMMVKAGTGQGTGPVRQAYWGIAHTDLLGDLEDCIGWKNTEEYASHTTVDDAEWGAVGNTRWLVSTNAHKSSDATPVYYLPIIGQDAYGDVKLDNSKNIVKGFDQAGSPLNRYATSGWKCPWAARILNDNFMHILKVTKSS
jgi:N4-gp56 family major capsid protein